MLISNDPRISVPGRFFSLPVLILAAGCSPTGDPDGSASDPSTPTPDACTWEIVLTEQATDLEDPRFTIFIALSPVGPDTVWLAGATFRGSGRFARTVDGGRTWKVGTVRGTEGLEFRDVEAFDGNSALLMSAGDGADSRIYRTDDAGATWTETFRMEDPQGFIDCFDFWDDERGILYGDAIDGGLWVATTADGGRSWTRIPPDRLPEPIGVEGGYAAGGTCVAVRGAEEAWIVTTEPRVLYTADAGDSWSVTPTPFEGGANSVAVRPDGRGYMAGVDTLGARTATSTDGGRSWTPSGALVMPGVAQGITWLPDPDVAVLFAAGGSGLDWSTDGGASWSGLSTENRWAVDFGSPRVGWAVGLPGNVIRIDIEDGAGR